ncbi:MAG TPA: UvrD-helicase domain-containing protein [Deltaproteobacteria bacterium]|nr:UvrD-helicase domain-containing protein [Deltaproteobacteria bacterium]
MKFYCDLHVHSRHSRATSSGLTIRALAAGAVRKGISVLGTGDLTHPAWMKEIEEELVESEPGLYRLRESDCPTRFILTGEISTIYKQGDKVRKVHHVIGAPDIASAKRISASLAAIGNILSDGRPILGITSRNLLEVVLEAGEGTFLIPAHIWTPWFSALGSKSGFDSIAECYQDLEPYIFAVETGLSSDPPMNWMVKSLDRYRLVSCSDAHSADKLGREATVFDTPLDYHAIRRAMATGDGLVGTVEFFPEEGKYHLDGHRDCGVVLEPHRTREVKGRCPVCGRALTVGVLHRVEELAERSEGEKPSSAKPFFPLIPLAEIMAEIMQVASPTKRVMEVHEKITGRLGGELPLLLDAGLDEIASVAGETLALAVRRMRAGEVHKEAGYDGTFGRVRVFADNEQDMLFTKGIEGVPARKRSGRRKKVEEPPAATGKKTVLNPEQQQAAAWREGPLAVVAGPGTGKTRVLVERIRMLLDRGEKDILAVTFTTRAAREITERLGDASVEVCTFHALAARIMRDAGIAFEVADEETLEKVASPAVDKDVKAWVADLMFRQSTAAPLDREQEGLLAVLKAKGYYTYEGLIGEAMRLVDAGAWKGRWDHVMVDEFQDINPVQYAFLAKLSRGSSSVMVIGDPHQAIYGFRGSSPASFDDFLRDHPACAGMRLATSYRFGKGIARAANAFIGHEAVTADSGGGTVRIVRTGRPYDFIAREVEALAGGLSHLSVDAAKGDMGLSDMAVIVRTRSQAIQVLEALERAGIPCDTAYARPLAEVKGIRERISLLTGEGWETLVKGVEGQARELLDDRTGPLTDRIARIDASGMFRLPGLDAGHPFYSYARLFGDDTGAFVEFLRLSNDQGALGTERVHVLTAHAAKGLEFGCVFVTGLARGIFPLAGADITEEQNLFYVAMTRTKDALYLVCPAGEVSEFVQRIPAGYASETTERDRAARPGQMVLFE